MVAAGVVLRTFETNAAAWRWIDRQEGSPISPSRGGVGLDREQRDHANRRRRGPGPTKGGKLPWSSPTVTEVTDPEEARRIRQACDATTIETSDPVNSERRWWASASAGSVST